MAKLPGGVLKAFLERRGGKKAAKPAKSAPGSKAAALMKGKCKMCAKMGKTCPECKGKMDGKGGKGKAC